MFARWWLTLDQVLLQQRDFWQLQPMLVDWPTVFPAELVTVLEQFTLTDCVAIDASPSLQRQHFARFFPELFAALPELPREPEADLPLPFWLSTDIGGRKWQQITQLAASVGLPQRPVLEWCAGKGHLGKVMSYAFQAPVVSLEWQQSLCNAGQQKAQQLGLLQRFVHIDVLQQPVAPYLQPAQQVVALHACGDLHRVAAREAVRAGCAALALVPCCYHLQQAAQYQPLSVQAHQPAPECR